VASISLTHGIVLGDPTQGSKADPLGAGYRLFRIRVTRDASETWIPVLDAATPHPGRDLQPLPGEAFFAASNSSMAINGERLWIGTSRGRVLRREFTLGHFTSPGFAGMPDPYSLSCAIPWTDWQIAQVPLATGNASSGIFSLAFRDSQHGIAVGGDYKKPNDAAGTAAWTADGGKTWTAAEVPPHGYRSAVAWDANAKAWIAVGPNGSDVSYDDGKTWSALDSAPGGGNWNALSLPWVVGSDGRIARLATLPARK
jgi:hypothetical protein